MLTALFRGRQARPASAAWNVLKTLTWTALLWAVFLGAVPWLYYGAESLLGLEDSRLAGPAWRPGGLVLLVAGGLLYLVSGLVLAVHGNGTPLYLDGPLRLVSAGPYGHVGNPMNMALLAQGVGVGLWLGPPLTLAYVVAAGLLEQVFLRPREEAALERRFGEAYRLYRRRVRRWRPRLRRYDPAHEAHEPPLAAERTTPPGRYVLLYDGLCNFCRAGAGKLIALARPGAVEGVNFQEPGALERFPGVPLEACLRQMYLVTPAGRVYGGVEAAVRALATRPVLGLLAHAYYLPGLRLGLDLLYTVLAANRYRLLGKAVAAGQCQGGTCVWHAQPR